MYGETNSFFEILASTYGPGPAGPEPYGLVLSCLVLSCLVDTAQITWWLSTCRSCIAGATINFGLNFH